MKAKRTIIALVLAVLPIVGCQADKARFLVINGKDETKTIFALADNPKILCKSGELIVVAGDRTFKLSLADVQNYQFSCEATGIAGVMENCIIKQEDGSLAFSGLRAGCAVFVCLQDGRLLKECKADDGGNASVELSSLPKGVLIIRYNKSGIKIVNR